MLPCLLSFLIKGWMVRGQQQVIIKKSTSVLELHLFRMDCLHRNQLTMMVMVMLIMSMLVIFMAICGVLMSVIQPPVIGQI